VPRVVLSELGIDGDDRSFEVSSTVQLDGPTGAVVMWVLFGTRRSLGRDAALAHWREVHAPLARKHHVGMCRYVQHVVTDGSDRPPRDLGALRLPLRV
jgi:hypothetical protein